MNDTDIKEALQARAARVTPPVDVPRTLKRRIRRRQARNALIAAGGAVILATFVVVGWRAIDPLGRHTGEPAGPPTTRTATPIAASGDSLYGPWRLTSRVPPADASPAPAGPLQLWLGDRAFDVGHPVKDPGAQFIDPQALVLAHITGADDGSPYEVGTLVFGSVGPDVASVEFRVNPNAGDSTTQMQMIDPLGAEGRWNAFGTVTEADSGTLTARDAAGNVLEEYALEPFVNSDDPADFRLVLAEGEQGGTSWRLTSQPPLEFSTDIFSGTSGSMGSGSGAPIPGRVTSETIHEPGLTLAYGSVPVGAASVAVTEADGTVTNATIVRCPCGSIDGGFDFFYAELPANATVDTVTPLAADGTTIEASPLPVPPHRVAVPSPNP